MRAKETSALQHRTAHALLLKALTCVAAALAFEESIPAFDSLTFALVAKVHAMVARTFPFRAGILAIHALTALSTFGGNPRTMYTQCSSIGQLLVVQSPDCFVNLRLVSKNNKRIAFRVARWIARKTHALNLYSSE